MLIEASWVKNASQNHEYNPKRLRYICQSNKLKLYFLIFKITRRIGVGQGTEYRVQGIKYRVLSIKYKVLGTKYKVQDYYHARDTKKRQSLLIALISWEFRFFWPSVLF